MLTVIDSLTVNKKDTFLLTVNKLNLQLKTSFLEGEHKADRAQGHYTSKDKIQQVNALLTDVIGKICKSPLPVNCHVDSGHLDGLVLRLDCFYVAQQIDGAKEDSFGLVLNGVEVVPVGRTFLKDVHEEKDLIEELLKSIQQFLTNKTSLHMVI